jgi:hypothetical protein
MKKDLHAEPRRPAEDAVEQYISGRARRRGYSAPTKPCIACEGIMHLRKYTRLQRWYWRCDGCNCKTDLRGSVPLCEQS